MSNGKQWNLMSDGILWRTAAGALEEAELRQRLEVLLSHFQENLDRNDWAQLIAVDAAAAALIDKIILGRYEVAHTKISVFNSKDEVQRAPEAIRDSARIAAAFPSDDVLDRIVRYGTLHDRQLRQYLDLLDRLAQAKKGRPHESLPVRLREREREPKNPRPDNRLIRAR